MGIIGRKAREIAGDDIVTNGNEESVPWQHCNFITLKLYFQSTSAPYSTDNRALLGHKLMTLTPFLPWNVGLLKVSLLTLPFRILR